MAASIAFDTPRLRPPDRPIVAEPMLIVGRSVGVLDLICCILGVFGRGPGFTAGPPEAADRESGRVRLGVTDVVLALALPAGVGTDPWREGALERDWHTALVLINVWR